MSEEENSIANWWATGDMPVRDVHRLAFLIDGRGHVGMPGATGQRCTVSETICRTALLASGPFCSVLQAGSLVVALCTPQFFPASGKPAPFRPVCRFPALREWVVTPPTTMGAP